MKSMVELGADSQKVKREAIIKEVEKTEPSSSASFNTYKERLIGKGILTVSINRDGFYWIELPQFGEFVRMYHMDEF